MTSTQTQIGKDYYDSLSSLTINSRPIIESLTALAQENTDAATGITKAVEKRINKAIPSQKLYAFYLLDSICKNVGVPYPSLFGSNIFKLFTQAYSLVDDPTRVKLIKLFRTWKIPNAVTGLSLFDEDQIDLIDKFLIRATAANRPPEQQRQIDLSNGKATKQSLMREIDDLTNLVNSRLLQMPDDTKGRERFQLLQKLRAIISQPNAIPQEQLDFTKKQLQSIRGDELLRLNSFKQQQQRQQIPPQLSTNQLQGLLNAPAPSSQAAFSSFQMPFGQQNQGQQPQLNNANAQALFNMMSAILGQHQNNVGDNGSASGFSAPQSSQSNTSTMTATTTVNKNSKSSSNESSLGLTNLEFLKDILRKSKAGVKITPSKVEIRDPVIPPGKDDSQEVILQRFELTQNFINNHKPTEEEIALIYSIKDNQCSSCSKRFYSTPEGAKQKALHLDWHFRTNKKLKAMSKQIHNRSWFLPDKEWELFQEDEIVGGNDNNDIGVELNNRFNEKPVLTEEEMNKKVVTIPDDSENEIVCGICRDKLVGVFDDDSGEWVWRNAVKQRGRVYHYSCWVETRGQDRERSPERN
ncbi:DEKNAAC105061 [Brettanomyces naardenensis]|uniref:DEKNAAC105061 n=1 Tax=Brettanomyces naardenensis TaxID=13370 RepID=A0A448YS87_BRENA|nr:DEKNAAC105061 [Brettanomyces naardenensis]